MKIIFASIGNIFILILFCSCSSNRMNQQMDGVYSTNESNYKLQLNTDSTFIYSIGFSGSLIAKCSGIWNYNSNKNSISLNCQKEFELEELTNTYMTKRNHVFNSRNNKLIQGKIKLHKK